MLAHIVPSMFNWMLLFWFPLWIPFGIDISRVLDTLTQFTWNLNVSSEKQNDKKVFCFEIELHTNTPSLTGSPSVCLCLAVRFSSVSKFSRVLRIWMERTNKVIYKWYVRVSSCKNWIVSGDLTFETRIDWDFRWMKKKTCLMKTKTIPSNCIRFGLDRNWARAHFWCKHLRSVT